MIHKAMRVGDGLDWVDVRGNTSPKQASFRVTCRQNAGGCSAAVWIEEVEMERLARFILEQVRRRRRLRKDSMASHRPEGGPELRDEK